MPTIKDFFVLLKSIGFFMLSGKIPSYEIFRAIERVGLTIMTAHLPKDYHELAEIEDFLLFFPETMPLEHEAEEEFIKLQKLISEKYIR